MADGIGGFESQMQDPQTERKEAFFYYVCCRPEASVEEEISRFSNVRRSFLVGAKIVDQKLKIVKCVSCKEFS